MLLRCYSVYDRKALQYFPPFHASADGAAVRSFSDLANDPNTNVGRHPGDFVLFFIGEYDDSKGAMVPVSPLVHVVDATAVVRATPAPLFDVPKDMKVSDLVGGQ